MTVSSGVVQEYHGVAGGTKDTCRENSEDEHQAQAASARHIADEEESRGSLIQGIMEHQ
ncbi:hypothetical protein [Anaplasma phagocytophilum]|uniref:Uncharacterized protein n=1 Tax=Anaplasma phagocytophilum str. CRT38 TaxID=1269275 RepID=S6GBA9_ANAPH|nr:hypothetical protein [Anaplasma phagocytophilum]EOA62456.1 hypothetical protein CRT38_04292 [Anaplasma phagocytophilum str. CRT38]